MFCIVALALATLFDPPLVAYLVLGLGCLIALLHAGYLTYKISGRG